MCSRALWTCTAALSALSALRCSTSCFGVFGRPSAFLPPRHLRRAMSSPTAAVTLSPGNLNMGVVMFLGQLNLLPATPRDIPLKYHSRRNHGHWSSRKRHLSTKARLEPTLQLVNLIFTDTEFPQLFFGASDISDFSLSIHEFPPWHWTAVTSQAIRQACPPAAPHHACTSHHTQSTAWHVPRTCHLAARVSPPRISM